ncbi:MAG: apolipoprotein A1/A4/E domain-containing protein, partial [Spirillospora sp.]
MQDEAGRRAEAATADFAKRFAHVEDEVGRKVDGVHDDVSKQVNAVHEDVLKRLSTLEETMLALAEALLRPRRETKD